LREKRRQEEVSGKLADEKPLEEVLAQLLRRSPSLARLFVTGARLANPFDTGEAPVAEEFKGRAHPTYFRFVGKRAGENLTRAAHLGQRFRLDFETDVENEYFRRSTNPGEFELKASLNGRPVSLTHSLNLFNGLAHLNVTPPAEAAVNHELDVTVTVTDWTLVEEFVCRAMLKLEAAVEGVRGTPGKRKEHKPPAPKGPQQPQPTGVELPRIEWVTRDGWKRDEWVRPMDEFSGLRATLADAADEETGIAKYDFFVNEDNIFLQTELKATKQEPKLVKAKFKYGMALVGLGALRAAPRNGNHEPTESDDGDAKEWTAEDYVALAADAVAPMLLPMIDGLGGLDLDEVESESGASDLGESLTD
jgi:hypothetical protein